MSYLTFAYFGLAVLMGIVASLWGSPRNITCAFVLIASVLFATFGASGFMSGWWSLSTTLTGFIVLDISIAAWFALIAFNPEPFARTSALKVLVVIELAMVGLHLWLISNHFDWFPIITRFQLIRSSYWQCCVACIWSCRDRQRKQRRCYGPN